MASVLHRLTKQFLDSVNTPDFDPAFWVVNPDLSAVEELPLKYWIVDGDTIRPATTSERVDIDDLEGYEGLTLDEVKRKVYDVINVYRDEKINMGVIYLGNEFDSDERARENILGMCGAISLGMTVPNGFTWRSKINENVAMNALQIATFGTSLLGFVSANFSTSWYHKDIIRDITTTDPLDIIRYDYTGGWPSSSLDGSTLL